MAVDCNMTQLGVVSSDERDRVEVVALASTVAIAVLFWWASFGLFSGEGGVVRPQNLVGDDIRRDGK